MAEHLAAVAAEFRLCDNLAAVQQGQQMTQVLQAIQELRREMQALRQDMQRGFQTQRTLYASLLVASWCH